MTELATFLRDEKDAIVRAFGELRPHAALAPRVPALLAALAHALEHGRAPAIEPVSNEWADLEQLIGELGFFRDAIYRSLDARNVRPALEELRVLGDVMALVMREAVKELATNRDSLVERQRRELLELFQQSPGFLGYVRGRELVYELENDAYAQIIGNRDIHGKSMREVLPELAGQGYFELLEGVLDTGKPFVGRGMQAHLQRTPGAPLETVIVDLIFQPIRDASGRVQGVLMQGNDVTAVAREEAARRQVEERFRALVQSMADGYALAQMITDESGKFVNYRFVEVNPAFERQTGLANPIGKTAHEMLPGLDPIWFERYGEVARTGVPFRIESHIEGLNRWYDIQANRVGDPEQKLVAVVFNDITPRRAAEAERERALSLESTARADAENANRLRDDFLATVSHELRTPLNAMLGWVQMLRVGTLSPEKTKHALATIERNARAQTQLIDDLLDVSRILAGKLRLELEPVDVKLVVEAVCDAVQPAALAKEVQVECATQQGLMTLGDAHRLQQIIGNLLSNAIKFTPRRGRVKIVALAVDSVIRIGVTDTGQGIAPDFLPHVFERFRQANASTTRAHGGLGLGLAIARQLVELHGGKISAASEGVGKGATFIVELPRAASAGEPGVVRRTASSAELRESRVLAGRDVLVVEDEADTRDMLRSMVEMLGGKVRVAANAREAFASLTAAPPDLLLSDVAMPEEDGYSLIGRIRQLAPERGGRVPAVAITAFSRTEDRMRALRAGFDSHVAKPVEASELTAILEAMLARAGKPPPSS